MKNIIKTLSITLVAVFLSNCKSNDDNTAPTIRDRQEVYNENISQIETYLKTHKMVVVDEYNISFEEVEEGSNESIWNSQTFPLQQTMVKNDTRENNSVSGSSTDIVDYKIYYIVLNQGSGEHPRTYDNVYTIYSGYTLQNEMFDKNTNGFWSSFPKFGSEAIYTELVSGYRQALTLVKPAASITINPDGTFTAQGAGRVVAFIPSGLAYFNSSRPRLGSYKPLIFDITLLTKKEVDHDGDGLLTKYEDVDQDGNIWNDDTDSDKKPNFLDTDDDADGQLTRKEISYQTTDADGNTTTELYTIDEIPSCAGGTLPKHLDPTCQ